MARKKQATRRKTITESGIDFSNWQFMTPKEFGQKRHAAHQYYYQEYKSTSLMECVWEWMGDNGYSQEDIKNAKNARGVASLSETVGAWCKVLQDGCPDYNDSYAEFWQNLPGTTGVMQPISSSIRKYVDNAIESGLKNTQVVVDIDDKKPISIQERIDTQCSEYTVSIDLWLDTFIEDPKNFDPNGMNVIEYFNGLKASALHFSKIRAIYEKEKEEMELALLSIRANNPVDDVVIQMAEAYGYLKQTQIRRYIQALQNIIDACNLSSEKKKVERKPRKKKQPTKEKIVANVKYCAGDDALKLVSMNPIDILDSKEVWVYNVRYRKLGKYVANDLQTMTVKGSTIVGFDPEKSIEKILRKPETQLSDFKSCGKVLLRKFMDQITSKGNTLTGRLNANVIILKVVK